MNNYTDSGQENASASPEDGEASAYGGLPPRTVGDILNATFALYMSAPWAFVGFVGIALVPQIPSTLAALTPAPVSWVLTLLGVFLSILATGALVYATVRHLLGREWDILSSYTRALERVVSLVVAFVVYVLVLISPLIIASILGIFIESSIDQNVLLAIVVGGAILLLVLSGIPWLFFILVAWYFQTEAIMIEGRRNLDALSRSYQLVKGSWWRVFGIGALFVMVMIGFFVVAAIPVVIVSIASQSVGTVLFGVATVLITPFMVIGGTLLYLDLRVRKESYTLDRLAAELGV